MLEIVLERTVLQTCMKIQPVLCTEKELLLVQRIKQHCHVITSQILAIEEEFFRRKSEVELQLYKDFIASRSYNAKQMRFLPDLEKKKEYIKTDTYLNELVNVCMATEDKLLLSDKSRLHALNLPGLHVIGQEEAVDETCSNEFSRYSLPIHDVAIPEGADSKELGKWIGRFLRGKPYIVIHDNYIAVADNIKNFRKYICKYIDVGAEIHIYTVEDSVKKADIIAEFTSEYYKKWDIHVFLAKSKREHHPRQIRTDEHIIKMDRGISAFEKSGRTFHSVIDIEKAKLLGNEIYHGKAEQIV